MACQSQPEDCADYELLSQSQPGCAQHFAGSQSQMRSRSCADRVVACQSQPEDCADYGVGSRSLLQSCADRTVRSKAFALCLAIVVTVVCKLYSTPAYGGRQPGSPRLFAYLPKGMEEMGYRTAGDDGERLLVDKLKFQQSPVDRCMFSLWRSD